jgi:hypothetical protein
MIAMERKEARTLASMVVPWLAIAGGVALWKVAHPDQGWGWKYAALVWILYGTVVFFLARAISNDAIVRRFIPPASARSLGIIRVVVCLVLLGSTLWEDVASSAVIPPELRRLEGLVGWLFSLPGVDRLASSRTFLLGLKWITALALACGVVGLRTRLTLPIASVGYILIAGILRFYTWSYHTGLIPWYLLVILCVTPCSDGLSLDARLRERQGRSPSVATPEVYGLARYACWLAFALPYVVAGLSKLRIDGLRWFDPDNMRLIVYLDSLQPMEFSFHGGIYWRNQLPAIAFTLMAAGGVGAELGYVAVLVSRWARLIMPVSLLGLHLGILLLQNLCFPDLIALQAIFLLDRTALPSRTPEVAATGSYPLRGRFGILCVMAALLVAWSFQLERFPMTGMQMYTGHLRPPYYVPGRGFYYHKVRGLRADGVVVARPIEEGIGALRDSRYREYLGAAFRYPGRDGIAPERLCTFMQAVARGYRPSAPPQERLAEIEFERWAWDFQQEPTGPWDSQDESSGPPAVGHLQDRITWDLRAEPSPASGSETTPPAVTPKDRSLRIPCGPGENSP